MSHDINDLWQMLQSAPAADDIEPEPPAPMREPETPDDVADLIAKMNSAEPNPAINGVDHARAMPLTEYMTTLDEATLAHIAIRVYDMVRNRTSPRQQRRLHDWVDNHPILLDRTPVKPLSEKTISYYARLND
jgi:hypothetical protein